MFYIIEAESQLQKFNDHYFKEAFLQIVPLNYNYHPELSSISLIYIRPFNSHKGFMMCLNTDESFNLDQGKVLNALSKFEKLYVVDKKDALYYLPFESILYDIKLQFEVDTPNLPIFRHYYNTHPHLKDVNKLIPISLHYEYCETLFNSIAFDQLDTSAKWYKFYNTYAIPSFYLIEQHGITTDVEDINNYFKPDNVNLNIKDNIIYTKYNLYNLTSRPSNSFNNINFVALNKTNGCRTSFKAKNDALIEMDYDSYHIRILGKLIGYKFSDDNIHEYLGCKYFNTDKLTPEQYKESKGITFKILYTEKRIEEYLHIEFFQLVKEYKELKWNEYQKNGFLISEVSGKRIIGINKKTKLLPYILQNYETETNVVKLYKILRLLNGKQTNLIFYNYDAIVLDVCKADGKEMVLDIQKIMEQGGYPIHTKIGLDLNFA